MRFRNNLLTEEFFQIIDSFPLNRIIPCHKGKMRYKLPMLFPIALIRAYHKLTMLYFKLRTPLLAWVWGVQHGKRLIFQGRTIIRTRQNGEIVLGDMVIFNAQHSANLVGLTGPSILETLGGGKIIVGDRSGFSSVVISSHSSITIGSRVKMGGNVRVFDHDYHAHEAEYRCTPEDRKHIRTKPVVIEDDCFIGTNAIILKGTHLGARTIVAAGSVVFGLDVPADSMVKGNQAEIVERK